MKNYLLTVTLLLSVCWTNAQSVIEQKGSPAKQPYAYKLKAGDTYTQTYLNDRLGNTLQIRARQRFSFIQIAKASLPFLAGTAYGFLGGKSKSSSEGSLPGSSVKLPSILGGAAISGASFVLKSNKKASVNLIYRNALGQIIHEENQLIRTGKRINIGLWQSRFESVDVSVTAPTNQDLNVQQGARLMAASDSSGSWGGAQTNNACENCPQNPDNGDNYSGYMGSISNPYQYYGFYNQYAGSEVSYAGGNEFYYFGSGANGSGYYNDPSFTEPGGAGYYPTDNPGPAPVNGPGLYPASRQAEVYKYMWQHQSDRNVEQVALMTDRGIFILPDQGSTYGNNTLTSGYIYGFPGINIQQGMNGQKAFIYKNTIYYIEGVVHTHPPASRYLRGGDGESIPDREVANDFKVPNFVIADEGIWRIRPGGLTPGDLLYSDYTKVFDPNYTISNLYGYK